MLKGAKMEPVTLFVFVSAVCEVWHHIREPLWTVFQTLSPLVR